MGAASEHFDAVVVGSGFGGSVMAYRLAEAGRRVCVLERGRAYPPGSFPRTPDAMRANFWDPAAGLYGMFDLWSFRGIEALVGSGLGGGSLIYANVLLRKDEHWFVTDDPDGHEHWPVTRAELDPHYDAVEAMIRPQRYPVEHSPYRETPKTRAYVRAAERLDLDLQHPPLAVRFANDGRPPVPGEPLAEAEPNRYGVQRHTCRLVGECDIGCNWGAKETLDLNYLAAAERAGAELRTGVDARDIWPRAGGGYRLGYVRHPHGERGEVTADRLVLAAGTLGSSWLLLRNRARLGGLGPALGTRFCGNGDLLAFAVDCDDVVDPARGPVITSAIRHEGDGRGFYVEDAGLPGFASWMLVASDTPGALRRAAAVAWQVLRQRLTGDPQSNMSAEAAALLANGRFATAFLPLLGMGRDVPDGRMSLTRSGYLDIDWRTDKSGPYFERVRAEMARIADALGAERLVDNPIWHLRRVITVHPLGGCPMGRHAGEGVVDSRGEVFGLPGLHVADGAVMPGPVGANPSLTIAALSDRFAEAILAGEPGEATQAERARPVAVPQAPVAISFTEEMKGFATLGETDFDRGYRRGREAGARLAFRLTIAVPDVDAFVDDPDRAARASGWVEADALGGRRPVTDGAFNLLVGERASRRMRYLLPFADAGGAPRTLRGHKVVEDDPGFDVWRDTTTLYTHVLDGHASAWDDELPVLAAGVLHIHLADFARQLTTFRSEPRGRLDALARFGRLFAGELWETYAR